MTHSLGLQEITLITNTNKLSKHFGPDIYVLTDRHLTNTEDNFNVDPGHIEYVRLPFGLKNTPSMLGAMVMIINNVLNDLK